MTTTTFRFLTLVVLGSLLGGLGGLWLVDLLSLWIGGPVAGPAQVTLVGLPCLFGALCGAAAGEEL